MQSTTPFQLIVTGEASIPHPAELALIAVSVSTSGPNKSLVSTQALTTAKTIESLLSATDLSPPESGTQSPLAHYSKTSLSSTSHIPYNPKDPAKPLPRQYNASIAFDIRFRDFAALGSFGTKISSLPHVEVQNITWTLTSATEEGFRSELRRRAAKDALVKARDYCEVLGCGNLRAVELQEGDVRGGGGVRMDAGFSFGGQQQQQQQQSLFGGGGEGGGAGLFGSASVMSRARGQDGGQDERAEELSFDAQEVKMSMDVTVKFHADHAV